LFAVSAASNSLPKETTRSLPEEIEWTWEVRPEHPEVKLPNVLLSGDSITRDYYPAVVRQLTGRANVYLMATSASVGDPRLPAQIAGFVATEGVHFRVVHFNNGMHGWVYSELQYKRAFPSFLRAIQVSTPGARLIWATITPVKVNVSPGPKNSRIDSRNAIARAFIEKEGIPIDDLHELMMRYRDSYQDGIHFNQDGTEKQAIQVVSAIENAMSRQ
jgi:hypothetical protein